MKKLQLDDYRYRLLDERTRAAKTSAGPELASCKSMVKAGYLVQMNPGEFPAMFLTTRAGRSVMLDFREQQLATGRAAVEGAKGK